MLKRFILKEYGSWTVVFLSFLAGMSEAGWVFEWISIPLFLGILVFINSKQSLVGWIKRGEKNSFLLFLIQIFISIIFLILVFGKNILGLLPLAVIPLLYSLLLYRYGEHHLSTELAGFGVLCLPTLLVIYQLAGDLSLGTYSGVWLFFAASVFKVRVHLRKKIKDRWLMVYYCLLVVVTYSLLGFPLIASLPLIENLTFSIFLYNIRLKITGWTELFKGIAFLLLLSLQ
jgi:hypothetical protein